MLIDHAFHPPTLNISRLLPLFRLSFPPYFTYSVSTPYNFCSTPPLSRCYLLPPVTIFTPSTETHGHPRIVGVYKLAVRYRRCLHPSSSFPPTQKSRTSSYPILLIKPLQIWVVTFSIILFFSLNLYFKIFTIQNKMNKSL